MSDRARATPLRCACRWRSCAASSATRPSVFFAIVFPLMFLVLFGGIFSDQDPVARST